MLLKKSNVNYMEEITTNNISQNLTELHDILSHVVPNCTHLSKHINDFLKKYPNGCKTASSCVQLIEHTSVENNGVMFVLDDSLIFIGSPKFQTASPHYETKHLLNDATNIITSKKSITITCDFKTFIYKFKESNVNVIDYIVQLYKINPNWINIQNSFHNPSQYKIIMLTIGSRGDVQPFICLALKLIEKKYNVKIVTHECYKNFVTSNGIEFGGLSSDPKELMQLCANNSMFSMNFINEGKRIFLDKLDILLNEAYEECKHANILISTPTAIAGYHIAEKLRIPFFNAFTMPLTDHNGQNILTLTTSDYGTSWYSAYQNYLVDFLTDRAMWLVYGTKVNHWRTRVLNLPPKKFFESNQFVFDTQHILTLYCYSEHIFKRPTTWSDNVHVTGYWKTNIESTFVVTEQLETFIEQHQSILFVSFGSIPIRDPDTFYQIFIDYCNDEENDMALIIGKGWSTTSIESSDNVIVIDEVPYDYLLQHVKIMVHHGGAGTVSACAHAAVPMLVIPFFADQFFWGKLVQDLEIGCTIPYHTSNKFNIFEMIDQLNHANKFKSNVEILSEKLNSENGVENAIKIIENNLTISYIVPTGIPDSEFDKCANKSCDKPFTLLNRRHHCRNCTKCFCHACTRHFIGIKKYRIKSERVCKACFSNLYEM